jgi:hypothetical protein
MCVIAATVYAFGKTFLWPTMLAVVSERFPQGGAITIGAIGGVGMLSAGLLGGPGIGFKQDYFASKDLAGKSQEVFENYKADSENQFLWFKTVGLNGSKVGVLEDGGKDLAATMAILEKENRVDDNTKTLSTWWDSAKATADKDKPLVAGAGLEGGKQALKLTSFVPATMAVLYLLLLLYFRATGGYKQVHIADGMAQGTAES